MVIKENYENICELAHIVSSDAESGIPVHVYGKYETIAPLFNHLLNYNECFADTVILIDPEDTSVENQDYRLSVFNSCVVDVLPAEKCEDYCYDDDVIFVHEDCNSKLVKDIVEYYQFSIGEDKEIEESDDGHYIEMTETDDFGVVHTKSFYSDDLALVHSVLESWR